ncbi:MAG: 4Fe-4S dicluster domain-containing protein [Dehalococcoidales bacterium]
MKLDSENCIGCELCIPYCPVEAIYMSEDIAKINDDECVECGVCLRSSICPVDVFSEVPLQWPRVIRQVLSNPLIESPDTRIPGRGTEEVKTNEITGRIKPGFIGLAFEMGRPGTGTRFHDVQKMTMTLAEAEVEFEPQNPVTFWMTDKKTGKLRDDILNEKSLSAIVEVSFPIDKLKEVMKKIDEVSKKIDTVFSITSCVKVAADGSIPTDKIFKELGITASPNSKHNVGLGRPLFKFEEVS